jgi:asparagine synthase (glutamine-hydrolysing)
MGGALAHRGPDAEGSWFDVRSGLTLVHRRLSILDLSEAGSQPMRSSCGRFVLTYNGECYNFPELRRQLESEGCNFRGQSDTEIIVEGIARWGVRQTLGRLNGMFAFAVWDTVQRRLFLARDRIGIKPLYYGRSNGVFWFGSELKAARALPDLQLRLNLNALGLFFKFGYIPAPGCIFDGFQSLSAGHLLEMSEVKQQPEPICYWPLVKEVRNGSVGRFSGGADEAVDHLDLLLRRSVKEQMVSDVPLGAFLSGGVDSSTVVAMMQSQSTRPIKTFTIGFDETYYNEAAAAREVSQYLGTEHTELILTAEEALDVLPTVINSFDQPFADASALPTYVLSRLTRQHVTVSLSGDGGDELFAGYNHYPLNAGRLSRIEKLPAFARASARAVVNAIPEASWDTVFARRGNGPAKLGGHKLRKYASILGVETRQARYELMMSNWFDPHEVLSRLVPPQDRREVPAKDMVQIIDMMTLWDFQNYLPDDVLTKLDRASMAVSLESRVPILDHEIVEFAFGLPLSVKRVGGEGKWILREVLRRYLPRAITHRPKKGFAVPVGEWLKGPLREWGEELLSSSRLQSQGVLDSRLVHQKWSEHLAGKRDWEKLLWPVIMFEAWMDGWASSPSVSCPGVPLVTGNDQCSPSKICRI